MNNKLKLSAVFFLLIFFIAAFGAKAETLTIQVTKDAGLDWRGWLSYDADGWPWLYKGAGGCAAFYADVLNQLSEDSITIDSATFSYQLVNSYEHSDPFTIQVYRVTEDWSDTNNATYTGPAYGEGYGTADTPLSGEITDNTVNLDVTDLVQSWVDGTYQNYGVLIRDSSGYSSCAIYSEEAGDLGPTFTIEYSVNPGSWETDLSRGHRILVEKGLQIQALAFPWVAQDQTGFTISRFDQSKFTGLNFWQIEYPTDLISEMPGPQWGRWTGETDRMELTSAELPYLDSMVSFQYWDEPNIVGDPSLIQTMKNWFEITRQRYPDVIVHGDISGLVSYADHKNFVVTAQPDMVLSSWYPFEGGVDFQGGSPTYLYSKLQIWRRIGLEGLDGNGNNPIPYGYYFQTWIKNGRTPSQSEFNLEQFAAWAFGYKFLCAFLYSSNGDYTLTSFLFNGLGDSSPTWAFYQMASLNGMSRNLGPALVRLISTDVRMKMGEHSYGGTYVDNTTPAGVDLWSADADAYLTDVTATNLGTLNDGLAGDVVVGFFKPLHESFDGSNYSDQKYFMIVNGLTDPTGNMAACRQRIRLDFDFGSSGITSLQRMRRTSGSIETVELVSDGGSLYHLDLELDGGIGDLFKYNTGAPFVGTFVQIPGDANEDGLVDVGDLGILAANYGGSGMSWGEGDFNGDGLVDVGDLGILAANYGTAGSSMTDYDSDYAKVFGVSDADESLDEEIDTSSCGGLGLPLIAGLILMGLMLVKI